MSAHEHELVEERALADTDRHLVCTTPGCGYRATQPATVEHAHDLVEDTVHADEHRSFVCARPGCTHRATEPRADVRACGWCGGLFDLAVEGGDDDHRPGPLCPDCYGPCHCQHCDPAGATDDAMDSAR